MKTIKNLTLTAAAVFALSTGGALASEAGHIHAVDFSFEGPFGTYDEGQLQRGLQIYTEVCSACHGLQYVAIRTIGDEGGPHLPAEEVREYAKQFEAADDADDAELGDTREAKPSDHFPVSQDPLAPDLSLMAKARAGYHGPYGTGINQLFRGIGGPEYIVSILAGYEDPPACAPEDFDGNYNVAFAPGGYPDECKIYKDVEVEYTKEDGTTGTRIEQEEIGRQVPGSWMAMAQPLFGEDVEFADGHSTELHHEAVDVSAFLMWAAEPKMMARKKAGFVAVLLLTLLSVLLYATNKRIWAPVKQRAKDEAANS